MGRRKYPLFVNVMHRLRSIACVDHSN
jgi:hypothetical protein